MVAKKTVMEKDDVETEYVGHLGIIYIKQSVNPPPKLLAPKLIRAARARPLLAIYDPEMRFF